MKNFILEHFNDVYEEQPRFNPPATEEQIANLEWQLEITLPEDYKEFLRFTNGFEGRVNDFIVNFAPVKQVYHDTQINCSDYLWAIYIGTNRNVEMFVIDTRPTPFQFGLLPFIAEDVDFIPLGSTFKQFIESLILRCYGFRGLTQ